MSHRFNFPIYTDKMPGCWHGAYPEVYERLWGDVKESAGSVLEIGVDGFGFTESIADYFRGAVIVAIDVRDIPKPEHLSPRVEFLVRDAYTTECVADLRDKWGPFDAICEDGSHQIEHQEFFAHHYPSLLSKNGIAVIEDIAEHEHLHRLQCAVSSEFFTMGIDLTHHDNRRFDNRLLAIWRR